MYTIGLDFGTLSGRAILVDTWDGTEIAESVTDYPHGVMDIQLPSGKQLPPEWALQHPQDYLDVIRIAVPDILQQGGIDPSQVVGIGIDFTASSPLPCRANGTPLCFLDDYKDEPHAYVKLWKHHASQPQADRINVIARQRNESWLKRYGGKYSSEWFFSKLLQILDESPAIYAQIENFIEASDWIVWQLTGQMSRNTCVAGYKMLVQDGQYPSEDYFGALHPDFRHVIRDKVPGDFAPLGSSAGQLRESMAEQLGLPARIAVAVPIIDAHASAPAVKATQAGTMVMIMGTSTCHMLSADSIEDVAGICGVVDGGIIDGLYGYEAGQSAVGDIFAWFVDHAVPPEYHQQAQAEGLDIHTYLEREASKQQVGEHGLLALDWWNGNRSTLVDTELSGLLIGATLATRAPDIYRALIEATAYGTREIIEAFSANGIAVNELVAAGGLPEKNALLRQIYADVTGRTLKLAGSAQSPALGSAIHASVAAEVYPTIAEAADKMGKLKDEVVHPIPENQHIYDQLYAEYRKLYDYFGRGDNNVMKTLKHIRNTAKGLAE